MKRNKIEIVDGKKPCCICKENLPIENFSKNSKMTCGLHSRCRKCTSDIYLGLKDEYSKLQRKNHLKRTFGMTIEEYNNMLVKQNNCCAICKQPETSKNKSGNIRYMSVDHDHTTGRVRVLLCHRCNHLLGMSTDSIEILQNAIVYLETFKNEHTK